MRIIEISILVKSFARASVLNGLVSVLKRWDDDGMKVCHSRVDPALWKDLDDIFWGTCFAQTTSACEN